MSRRALIAIALVAATADARADNWDATYAFGANVEAIGGEAYSGVMMQIQVWRRLTSRLSLSATAELASAKRDEIEGGVVRGLAGVDLELVRGRPMLVVPALIASVGSGTETIAWDRGTLTRPMSYLGVEYRSSLAIEPGGFLRNLSSFGFRFGVRGHVAPGVAHATVAKLCSACSMEDAPDRGLDLGFVGYMGFVFGR
jgi:hypothetical protein